MRFLLAVITLLGAAVFSNAAVIPRANLKPTGIEARYYDNDKYGRADSAQSAVEQREPQLRTRRLHAREFHTPVEARYVENDVGEREDIYKRVASVPGVVERREPQLRTRRLYAREFRRRMPFEARDYEIDIYARDNDISIVFLERRGSQLRLRRLHARQFRMPIVDSSE